MKPASDDPQIQTAHDQAVERGKPTYRDPNSGYSVFTRPALERQGYCCGCECRHCPYEEGDGA